jgi:hypothetical protein
VRTGTALRDQPLRKKRLAEGREGGFGFHQATPFQRASRSTPAADISSGVFVRYQ